MRATRLLAVLGTLAVPALALAQTPADGGIVGLSGDDNNINADECNGVAGAETTIDLAWNVKGTLGNGVYRMFASNKAPTTSGDLQVCATEDEPTSTTFAGRVFPTSGSEMPAQAADIVHTDTFPIAEFIAVSRRPCDADSTIHICVHFYPYQTGTQNPDLSTVRASAVGTINLSVGKPNPPTNVTVKPGDRRLYVSWKVGTGGTDAYDFLMTATPTAGGSAVSDTAGGTSGIVDGLENLKEYSVVVVARSASGTKSDPSSPAVLGTPQPVSDFWEVYKDAGGQDDGGCGGPAGPLALLGLATLALAARRRAP